MVHKKYLRPAVIAALLMVVVGITGYISVQNGWNKKDVEPTDASDQSGRDPAGGEKNLIEGGYSFFPDDVLPDGADASVYTLPPEVCGIKLPFKISGTPLTITRIAKYSGDYVEDMSNENVDDCLAVVVKNEKDDTVTDATVVFKVNNTEEAVFELNTLPSGKSCVVLERNRRKFSSSDNFVYDVKNEKNMCMTRSSNESKAVDISEKVDIRSKDGEITVVSRSDETYDKIYVLYKNVRENIYLGGVTYTLEFDNVVPGMEQTRRSQYFKTGSEIVEINKSE